MLRPRPLSRIGVALEHNANDAEILNRRFQLAQSQADPCELTLLHVVDTAMTRVLGPETADRESDADERYLADLVDALRERGYRARPVLLHGPNPAEELVAHLQRDPVDLLVVGSHGHGMVRDLLLGQTVDRVRHRLEVPMLIARPDRESSAAGDQAAGSVKKDDVNSSALFQSNRSCSRRLPAACDHPKDPRPQAAMKVSDVVQAVDE